MTSLLLIDDEPNMGDLVAMTLENLDVRVTQVTSLADAVDAARKGSFALVLLDVSLGREDGLANLPFLRAEPALANVPVVIFTVHDSMRAEALEQGVEGFVAKPFKAESLRSVLKPYLE